MRIYGIQITGIFAVWKGQIEKGSSADEGSGLCTTKTSCDITDYIVHIKYDLCMYTIFSMRTDSVSAWT